MSNLPKVVKKNLQDILKDEGLLKEDVLGEVVARQKQSGVPLHRVLHEMGLLSEIDLLRAISRQLNLPYIDASTYKVSRDVMGLFPVSMMMEHQFTVLDKIGRVLVVAIAGQPPADVVEKIEKGSGSQAYFFLSTVSQIEANISSFHMSGAAESAGAK
jgi:type II secretion system (T2SS) protein E